MINDWVNAFVGFIWGAPMLVLLVGGGLWFTLYARLQPFRHFRHSLALLTGRYDRRHAQGDLTHRQALSAALAGTLGLGNIAGVALAISAGGPGAIFWMWVTALVGVSTKYYTCSLGIMYRGRDSLGQLQGGPMYIVQEGLGKRWQALAVLFAVAGLFGTFPSFQVNQLVEVMRTQTLTADWVNQMPFFNWVFGIALALLVGSVIWGGLQRVAHLSVALVPTMVIGYLLITVWILGQHASDIPHYFQLIFNEAWQPSALSGGLLGVIIIGVSRGAFSNEAGIGTEVMAHSAAKTNEPIREGLVASLGPVIDTLIVCSCTALIIIASNVWQNADGIQGVQMTMLAFHQELGLFGEIFLALMVLVLSLTTIFTFWYYGSKCFSFLLGAEYADFYKYLYLAMIVVGAVMSMEIVFNFMIGMYGLMAIPTMVATLILAPKVNAAAKTYFAELAKK